MEVHHQIVVMQPCILCEQDMEQWTYTWELGVKQPTITVEPPPGGPHICQMLADVVAERYPWPGNSRNGRPGHTF